MHAWFHITEYMYNGLNQKLERQLLVQYPRTCPCFRQRASTSFHGCQLSIHDTQSQLSGNNPAHGGVEHQAALYMYYGQPLLFFSTSRCFDNVRLTFNNYCILSRLGPFFHYHSLSHFCAWCRLVILHCLNYCSRRLLSSSLLIVFRYDFLLIMLLNPYCSAQAR